jgi:hypothetical protein
MNGLMSIRTLILSLLFSLSLWLVPAGFVGAASLNTVQLSATRTALLANGKQTSILRAYVRDSSGRLVGDNVMVQFQTTLGTLSAPQAPTHGGVASVTLTSAPSVGVAHIIAIVSGGSSPPLEILFTDDPEATFEGNNYMLFSSNYYLAYSATDKAIEAIGKSGGAKLNYRNIEINADRMQLNCESSILRARDNVTLKRGTHMITASRLYYSLQSGQGWALVEKDGRLVTVTIFGDSLSTEISPAPMPSSFSTLPELQVKLIISANSITYFPGDRLQFRHPKFYQDLLKILELPYYQVGLYSTELFSDQFFSLGTNGFGLELPFYYNLSPRSSGIAYLRHQPQVGRSSFAYQPGWAVDLVQSYSSQGTRRYEGAFAFTGLTRSDWGFRFTHNQEFNSASQGSFYLEFPQHDSVFTSANFTQQFKALRAGANFSAGQTFTTSSITSSRSDFYVETQPHRLVGSKDFQYTIGTTYATGSTISKEKAIPSFSETTEQVNLRAFTRPIKLDSRTTFTNSYTVGHIWSNRGATGLTALATLGLDHTLPGGGVLNLTYDYVTQPGSILTSSGKHRVSATYNFASRKRFQAAIFGSAYLDAPDASILADFSYRLDSHWRFLASATLQKFNNQSFNDLEFTIGRRIGAREFQLTYSTFNKRISFDLTATRF